MINSEFARISDGLRRTRVALRDYIVGQLRSSFSSDDLAWWRQGVQPHFPAEHLEKLERNFRKQLKKGVLTEASDDPANVLEFSELRTLAQVHWTAMFAALSIPQKDWLDHLELLRVARNEASHANANFEAAQVTKVLGVAVLVLEVIGSAEVVVLRDLRDNRGNTPKGLPLWWQVATPHVDIREGSFDENAFAAKLDDVVANRAAPEYQDATYFFDKTYFTKNLRALLCDTLKRLNNTGGQAVTQLRTPFGGGKTHALISLYHMIWNAAKSAKQSDIASVIAEAGFSSAPEVNIAVLVGTAINPLGREVQGVQIKTLWGEMAFQVAGTEGYKHFAEHDELRIAPGKEQLWSFFERYGSTLILLDELLVYQTMVGAVKAGDSSLRAQTFAFLQQLTEVVGGMAGLALVTTFPQSHLEYYDHADAPVVFDTLEKIFGRLETVRVPVQGDDVYEVVRRRLFETPGDPQAINAVVQAYWQEYQRFADDLPSSVRNVAYLERMRKSYPFHPALIDALQERWSSLQSFQRTRGVLRLLARVAVQFYGNNLAGAMIGPANMSLYDDRIRASVIDIVGEQYEAVAASDLAEPGERARGVDRERGGLHVAKRLAEGAANTIFLYSHTGGGVPGASLRDVTLALIEPDVAPALVTDVLERLKHRLYYLHAEGELLSFKAQPNLNRVLEDRKAMVAPKVPELLRESAKGIAQSKGNAKIIAWPGSHQDVPDNRDIKIVLLGPDHPDGPEAERLIAATIDAAAGARRQFPNTVVFVIPHSASFHTAGEHARELLAIRDLEGDTGTYSTLSEVQREELRSRKTRALQAIPNALRGAYQWVCKAFAEPATPNERIRWKREARAEIQTESDVVIAVLKILETGQVFTRKLDPALLSAYYKLWNDTDQDLNTVSLRDYFSQLPHLPLLENDEVLRDAVARGISSGLFALAVKSASGYDLNTVRREGTATNVGDVEFSSVRFLVKPGVIPAPQAPSSSDLKTADPILVIEPIIPPSPSTNPTRKAKHQRVRVIFDNLEPEKSSKLIDALFTLQDGGATTLRLTIEANTAQSLDKAQIELNLPEVLSQNGLQAILEWDASS